MIAGINENGGAVMGQRFSRNVAHQAKRERLLGTVCCNCGKECGGEIEYHHVVPLERGGKDIVSNLAPLCYECHSVIHFQFERKKPERTGRKRKVYDAALLDSVFSRYVNKELSEVDAKKELGTGCHIKDMPQFREWAEEHGVDITQVFGRSGRWYR
jgi:formate-dependent nitrite reductase cytochrome c552 subunit